MDYVNLILTESNRTIIWMLLKVNFWKLKYGMDVYLLEVTFKIFTKHTHWCTLQSNKLTNNIV